MTGCLNVPVGLFQVDQPHCSVVLLLLLLLFGIWIFWSLVVGLQRYVLA